MSMTRCQDCGELIDSDLDPDCFVEQEPKDPRGWDTHKCLCTNCREDLE